MNSTGIHNELEYISQYLTKNIEEIEKKSGLFSGYLGVLLFFIEYNKLKGGVDEIIDKLKFKLIQEIRSGQVANLDLASGISGYLFVIFLLEKNLFLEKGTTQQLFKRLKPLFLKVIKAKINKGDYDFLYGFIGIIYVCEIIEDNFATNNGFIELILKNPKNLLSWRKESNIENAICSKERVDYGFAHGIPSLIGFLLKIYDKYPEKALEIELCQAAEYLDTIAKFNNKSYYSYSSNVNKPTRLAWCYGDLPNAILLGRLGASLEHDASKDLSEKILRNIISDRLAVKSNGVADNCLCHGTLGISLQLNYINKLFNVEIYDVASQHWLNIVKCNDFNIENIYFPDSSGTTEEIYNMEKYSLLEGMPGCGLAYLSLVNKERLMWEDLLMIN